MNGLQNLLLLILFFVYLQNSLFNSIIVIYLKQSINIVETIILIVVDTFILQLGDFIGNVKEGLFMSSTPLGPVLQFD